MGYWLAFIIVLLLVFLVYVVIGSARVLLLSPEERQKRIDELRAKQAALKTTQRTNESNDEHRHYPHSYSGRPTNNLRKFENDLTTMWAGDTKPVEFTYVASDGDRTRRTVKVDEVSFNSKGQFYLSGICLVRNDRRTFKVDNIETKLKVGSKRYDFEEWCVEMLDILPSEGFPQAYFDARS
ncbi:putative DNA-binding transcriptional regulator YafY [Aeromonas hydrophila]|uniref:WYL domain-containing protein n=1 Tax=Aeromonas hydrophila TaxID=644 RepID=UPI002168E0A3|nr:WYL domain-containing protein [Aeromonas hydrophila]MCS3769292.1 putative DNA-binding transcriptional regulator YafY [Aeromonas hydrophila]MCS3791511.1 putative DNA-binding transcriptional regulator YafY [Aeromonas hydrophila]